MPLTQSESTALNAATAAATQAQQVVVGLVAALVADPVPNPLQVALDAMTAERDQLLQIVDRATADMNSLIEQRAALQAKIDASKAHLQASVTADAAEDAARNAAAQALE